MFQSQKILALLFTYRYALLFPLACLEGPLVGILVGFFIHLGYLAILPSYMLLILGDFFPDTFYYYIGRFGNKNKIIQKYGSRSTVISANFDRIERFWQNHPVKMMFFSKLAYGLSIPLLISAGLARVAYRKFVLYAISVSVFQYGVFMFLGYYFGHSYELIAGYVKYAGTIIAVAGVLCLFIYFLVKNYARKQIIKIEEEKI